MKRVISFLLSIVMMFSIVSAVDLSVYADNTDTTSNSNNDFSKVSYTDVFYGYTWYLQHYNEKMRAPLSEAIVSAGEEFGADDKFFASLETTLNTVGNFSKTFTTITDALGITSRMNNDAADKAITDILKNIYEDENSDFWTNVINSESVSVKALKNSFSFIDNFNREGYTNDVLNDLYYDVLQQSIEKYTEFDVSIGKLNTTARTKLTTTVFNYYKDYITSWDYIVKLTKCINTVLFYQNVEIELIDYMLGFNNLDSDLVKGLKRIKNYINTNYATYFAEIVTKEVIDKFLNTIGDQLIYGLPVMKLAGLASQTVSWLFFDVIWKHADAEEYITYVYLIKFLYSIQYEMNKKLIFFNTDLVYSKTIDDFEYFYKIYSAIFKSSKKYAEKLCNCKEIEFEYNDYFFDISKFIGFVRTEIEKFPVDERIEKAEMSGKEYKFEESVILSNENQDSTCLVTFHNRVLAPLVIDNNVEYDNCDLIVPKLTISKVQGKLSIGNQIIVNGDFIYNSYESTLEIESGGIIKVFGDCNYKNQISSKETHSNLIIRFNGNLDVKNDFIINGGMAYAYKPNRCVFLNYGNLTVGKNLYSNEIIEINNYGYINISGNADFIAGTYITRVTEGNINLYPNSTFIIGGNLTLKGNNTYNTGNNWFILNIDGKLDINNNFSASNRFVSFNQTSINSVWTVNGDFYADVLNEGTIWGFDVGTCKGYTCNLSAGQLILRGNYKKSGGATITPNNTHTIILDGNTTQNINGINASNIIIDNANGVNFSSSINVTTLFNHNGNPFTFYNNGNGSSFPDYDCDGYKDNVDPYPLVKHPAEHEYVFSKTVEPTCIEKGYDAYICPYCNSVDKRNLVDIISHNYIFSETILPTCTAQGYDLYICSQCNRNEKRNYTNKISHKYEYSKTVLPTCTAQGYDLYTCTQCNDTEKRNTVSANGHKYSFTKTVEPTCTAQGYDLYTCSVCNGTEKRNTIDATGHTYEEKSNTATCTDAGVKTTVCSKCGDTKTSDVSALGHSYSKVYTAPTCTEDGGYTNTCTRCGDITHNIYSASGHDYGECAGQEYIDKISGGSISTIPEYFNEFYHISSSIGSTSKAAMTSTNMAVPNEIRLDINNLSEIKNYHFGIKGGIFSRKNCSGIFAYDKTTGRTPEQSAIPYTDKDGNLIDFTYVDYKVNGTWNRGHYKLNDSNQIIDSDGNIVCSTFEQTRTHIHYTKQEALDLGFMYSDGTVNAVDVFEKYEGIWFSAGIPGVYFTAANITPPMNTRRFIDVFGYDQSAYNQIKAGKYDVDLCFYNPTYSGLSSTIFKIYDGNLITKTPATSSADEKVTYTCFDCGETHTDTCKLNIADFKIKTVSLSLESSITMNFKVLKSAVADFENPYVVFNCEGDELTVTDYTEQGDYYVFSYPGISPQLMNDNVKAVLHATHNGIDYTSPEKAMSVRTYAYTMLERYNTDSYAELRTLLVDLLNYGAASQKYVGYQTDKLVNADLTDEQKSWETNTTPTFENIRNYDYKTIANPTSKWVGSGLVLNNSVMVRAKFSADNIENKSVKITCGKGTFTYAKDDFVQDQDGNYYVYCNEIFANEMSEEILLTVYDNGVQCSNTMRFSIESYAKLVHDNYNGAALDELTTAMMRYGNSAKAYGA